MPAGQRWVGVDFAAKRQAFRYDVLSPTSRRSRLLLIAGLAGVWCSVLIWRLVSLQITNVQTWQQWGLKQHLAEVRLASERGPVYDRYDRLLAVSVPAGSVYVRPAQVSDKKQTAEVLGATLDLPKDEILERLNRNKPFVWLSRQMPRVTAEKVTELKLPGVGHVLESKRYYPYNEAASAFIGKVGLDGSGLSGIELLYNEYLSGEGKVSVTSRDAHGNYIHVNDTDPEEVEPPRGDSLKLTIDAEIQSVLDQELEAARRASNAKATMGVMVDAVTGEILAMGQAPALNFNVSQRATRDRLKNLVVETVLEPGSIMKPIVAAAAIDAGLMNANELVDCENGRYPFGRHVIKDVHPSGVITLHDVVVRSSNVGMTKVGLRLGKERLYGALRNFGFGTSLNLGLAGETAGILRNVASWAPVDVATHAFGQGVAVTPLQVVRAVSAIANGGTLPNLHFMYREENEPGPRVLKESTAAIAREMMYGVVEDEHGTGGKSEIPGVRVGGKTGTAQKARVGGHGYAAGAYAASFVGFVDASEIGIDRTLTLIITVDEPHGGSIYGGTVAAPVFQRVMQRSLHLLAAQSELKGGDRQFQAARSVSSTNGTTLVQHNVKGSPAMRPS